MDLQAFENNFPYVLQATRNNPHKYEKDGSIVYLCAKTGEGPDASPNQPMVIVNALGKDPESLIEELVLVASMSGVSTILKNVDIDKVGYWTARGFEESSVPWSRYSFRDDNSYPQYILDRRLLLSLSNKKETRNTYRQIRKIGREMSIQAESYSERFACEARSLLEEYARFSQAKGKDFAFEINQAHQFMFENGVDHKFRLVHRLGGSLIAMTYWSLSDHTIYWNGCVNKNVPNLMRFLVWQGVSCISDRGLSRASWVALQGSESEGQDRWKRSFGPVKRIDKTHMVFYA